MSQGLYVAASGIRACQSKIDVVSDNIANMNTVGFKSSQVTFENVFSRTLSSGSSPSQNVGGSNPMQVGLGVTISDISRNFTGGTIQSTGRSSDLNIAGSGFFTVQNTDGSIYLTRSGNFTLNSDGSLTTPKGLRVLGTSTVSGSESKVAIKIPQSLCIQKPLIDTAGADEITNTINSAGTKITAGKFNISVNTGSGASDKEITITSGESISDVLDDIKTAIGAGSTATIGSDGKITITPPSGTTVAYTGLTTDTSNFLSVANFSASGVSGALKDASKATISAGDDTANTTTLSSWSVGKSGEIEATYGSGDKLTVVTDPNDSSKRILKLTSSGVDIVDPAVVASATSAAELQLQMANVVNPKGLLSEGGNMFQIAPNSGTAQYSIGSAGGVGMVQSGGLESSNVDLTSEFADMMLAQRGIDANSRTFAAQNQIMSTIVNLGRGG